MFITFEGIDGSGKSTMAKRFADWLKEQNKNVVLTREPGGTKVGEKLREVFLFGDAHPLTALYVLVACRLEIVQKVIKPALAAESIVVCDRYVDSTIAYQYYGNQLPWEDVWKACDISTTGLGPDLTFLLDIPVEVAEQRLNQRSGEVTRFDTASKEFRQRLRDGYLTTASETLDMAISLNKQNRFRIIDASVSEDEVFQQIVAEFQLRYAAITGTLAALTY